MKTEPNIILLGSGGHAAVLVDAMANVGVRPNGFADPARERGPSEFFGLDCIGNDDDVLRRDPDKVILVNGIGSTSRPRQRDAVFQKFKDRGYHFLTIVHPSAVIGGGVTIGEGAQIMAGVIVQTMAVIGANAILNTRCSVDHHTLVGESAHIAPGVTLCGGVSVGAISMVGAGATVIQGVKIGPSCLIGAGAVVREAMPTGGVRI